MPRPVRLLSVYALFGLGFVLASPVGAMSLDQARHLLSRTGFGGTPAELRVFTKLDYANGVRKLLDGTAGPLVAPPDWVDEPLSNPRKLRALSEEERKAFRKARRRHAVDLKAWWYQQMVATDAPLVERMTLFWHNHFTSSLRKVRSPQLMYRQNQLLREHALGSFRTLLHAVARDPAMILYLDNQTNRKQQPNENFARELLELFTLGEGYYSEQDIKEAARAFTGWQVDRRTGDYRFNPKRHDEEMKSFMGQRGNFNGDDIIDIVLEQPRVSEFIVAKLWREFVSELPDEAEVRRLASIFRAGDYEIKPLLQAMLTSPQFVDPRNRGTLIKSPVELIVGTVRMFDVPMRDGRLAALGGRALGQDILDPPNVKGWPGGRAWITSSSLLYRQQLIERLVRGQEMDEAGQDNPKMRRLRAHMVAGMGQRLEVLAAAHDPTLMQQVLLPIAPVNPPAPGIGGVEQLRQLLLDPAYQLK